jgi:MFS transporter, SP family, ERD6-like sugar transporter
MAERRVSFTERRVSFSERRSQDGTPSLVHRRASVGAGTVRTPLLRRFSDASVLSSELEEEDGEPSFLVYFVVAVCMLGAVSDGFVVGFSSPAAGALLQATSAAGLLTHTQLFVFEALEPLGCIAGALAAGFYADRFGRLRSLTITCAVFATGWIIVGTAVDAGMLFSGRYITGIGVGACVNILPIYVAEISPAGQRGTFASVVEMGFLLGIAVMFALGLPALKLNWRDMAFAALLPLALLAFAAETILPESPRWLCAMGRGEEASASLKRLRPRGFDVGKEMRHIKQSLEEWEDEPPSGFGDVTKTELARPLSLVLILRVLQTASGWGFVVFNLSPLFAAVGVSQPDAAATMVMAAQVPVALLESLLLDMAGRRTLLTSSASVMAAFAVLLAVAYSLPAENSWKDPLAITGSLGFLTSYSGGVGPVPCVLLAEILPNRYRVPAAAAVIVVSNLLGFIITITYGIFIEALGEQTFFAVAATDCVCIALFMFICIPETRGRSLEEVALLLQRCAFTHARSFRQC